MRPLRATALDAGAQKKKNPTWGNDPIFTNIFQMGWNHQLGKPYFFKIYFPES